MSGEVVIKAQGLSKEYPIFQSPKDRLKQMVLPRLQGLLGWPKQKYYHPFAALNDVSFEVRRGESLGIVGRNGSGKSTLLQIVAGTVQPSSGSIQVRGRVAALLELGSGFNPEFTGRENVYLNCSIFGIGREETDARFRSIEDFADIGSFIDQPVKTYSSGMTMRLAFAVIVHVDADVLIVDEALAVGDVFFVQKCMRFIRDFQKRGSLLFVTHDTTALQSLCQNAIWLEKGRLRESGSAKRISENYLMATYAERQDVNSLKIGSSGARGNGDDSKSRKIPTDHRRDFINSSNLRNDIKVFHFDPSGSSFGAGGAEIVDVTLRDVKTGSPLVYLVGGEEVVLAVKVKAKVPLDRPIVGFFIKNHLGQHLFGDNTYLTCEGDPLLIKSGELFIATFHFVMPYLPAGDYVVCVACAEGTQMDHVQHHWNHDALLIRSESSHVAAGLVGIPMQSIELKRAKQ
jgi:lipopolysaccharide transport system ATP-binding protein